MSLKTAIAADRSRTFLNASDFAQSITYNGTTINAVVEYGDGDDFRGGQSSGRARIMVSAADVAAPAYRDTVVIGSTTWTVYQDSDDGPHIEGDGYMWFIPLISDERPAI